MFRGITTVLFVLLLAPAGAQSPQQPAEVFRAETELVLVPTTVLDRAGQHIPGLQAGDFHIVVNGRRIEPVVFEEVTAAARAAGAGDQTVAPPPAVALPPNQFSNHGGESQPRQLTIILVDFWNEGRPETFTGRGEAFGDRVMLMGHLVDFVSDHLTRHPHEPIALYLFTQRQELVAVQDFTRDLAALQEALARVKPASLSSGLGGEMPPGMGPGPSPLQGIRVLEEDREPDPAARFDEVLGRGGIWSALHALAQTYAGVPGKKSILWITGGLRRPAAVTLCEVDCLLAMRALNQSQATLYPVDIRGVQAPTFGPASGRGRNLSSRSPFNERGLMGAEIDIVRETARLTGGRAYYNRNDIGRALTEATEGAGRYYLLGFYARRDQMRPGWHGIRIRTTVQNATLRHRSGFLLLDEAERAAARAAALELALRSPLESSGLPLTVRLDPLPSEGQAPRQVRFELAIPGDVPHIDPQSGVLVVEYRIAARKRTGEFRELGQRRLELRLTPQDLERLRAGGLTYSGAVELEAEEDMLRFVAVELTTARVGSVSAFLRPPGGP